MDDLTIGEVARRAGIRPSALRYYESVGLLPAPRRVNGRRRYDADVMQWLALVRLAQRAGFTVAETRTLLHGLGTTATPSERWRALARRKLDEVEALIARAQQMKRLLETGLACGCARLDACTLVEAASGSGGERGAPAAGPAS